LLAIEIDLVNKYEKRVAANTIKPTYFDFDFKDKGSSEKPNIAAGKFVDYETKFHIWKRPEKGRRYILGADVSRGDSKDYSTIQILDAITTEQVAEFQGKVPPDLFAYLIYSVAKQYNEAYVVVEANSFGLGTCLDLKNKMNYSNMFMSKSVSEIHVRPYDYKIEEGMPIPGFQTSRVTRPLVIKSIIEFMREGELILRSSRLIEEFKTFINKDGKQQHDVGFNDDLIFALGIALYIRSTEYNNVMMSKDTSRSMLDAISFNSSNAEGGNNAGRIKTDDADLDVKGGAAGLYMNNQNMGESDIDDDVSWLMG